MSPPIQNIRAPYNPFLSDGQFPILTRNSNSPKYLERKT